LMAPLATRTPKYLAQYGRTLNAAYRFEQIKKDIADEQGRVQYLDSLIGQERQTLAALQQGFAVQPVDLAEAQSVLRNLEEQRSRYNQIRQETLSREEQKTLTTAAARPSPVELVTEARSIIRGATPEKAAEVLNYTRSRLSEKDQQGLAAYAKQNATGKPPAKDARAVAAAEEEIRRTVQAGASGIRGGTEGEIIVERRNLTAKELEGAGLTDDAAALRDAGFATQADAFEAALEEVRLTGDPASISNPLARDLYIEARNKQAYRNDQRADFEQEVLDSRKRLAKLEGERQQIAGRYDDPAQEAIKRELIARGYKFAERGTADEWKNKYVQYQNTPLYDVLLGADRLVDTAKNTGKPLAPSTKARNMVTTLAMQYERSETPFDLNTLRAQLEKAPDLSKKDVDDALSFIVAYRELGGEKQDPDSIAFLKRQDELQKQEDEARRAQAEAMKAEVERARAVTRKLEEEQVRAISLLRTEQEAANLGPAEYTRLRAMGMSPEEARAKAMRAADTAMRAADIRDILRNASSAPDKVLLDPEFLMERQRRVEAAREAVPMAEPVIELPPQRLDLTTVQDEEAAAAAAQSVEPETFDPIKTSKEFKDTMKKARQAAPKPAAPKAPAPTKPAAPLPAIKASDALIKALETMDPKSAAYQQGLRQLNALLEAGN
jgi:hypothetical protein